VKALIGPCTPGVTCDNWWDFFNPGEWLEEAGESILDRIATGIGEFAQQLLTGVWWAIGEATTPDVNADFLRLWFSRTIAISLPIMVGFMILQSVLALLRTRGATGLGRMIVGAAVGVLGSFLALPVLALLVAAMDALAMDLAQLSHDDVGSLVTDVIEMLVDPSSAMTWVGAGILGSMGAIVAGIFAILGAIAVFIALLVRMMLLYIVVIIGPFAFAGLVWEPTRHWIRTWLTLVVALVFSKLGVVLVFGLGVSMIGSLDFSNDGPLAAIGQLVAGLMMLFMAALVPWACFKFFSFIGEESVSALHAGTTSAARGRMGGVVRGAASVGQIVAGAAAGLGAAGGGAALSSVRAPQMPTPPAQARAQSATTTTASAAAGAAASPAVVNGHSSGPPSTPTASGAETQAPSLGATAARGDGVSGTTGHSTTSRLAARSATQPAAKSAQRHARPPS